MIYEPETVKGFQDIFPPESQKREAIIKTIQNVFQTYGFVPLETPLIEYDELMRSDILVAEDEAISDRFRLKDKGGRNLGLRYEFTFQLGRLFKQNPNIRLPFRRYQIGPVFRDEPIGPNRFRQFTQADIDIVGDELVASEAECLVAALTICEALGIEAEILVNNRKLIQALIESVQITDSVNAMRELDKIDKIGEDAVKTNLKKYAETNQILTLFKLLEKDISFFKDNLFDGSADLLELKQQLKQYDGAFTFAPTLVRGLSYYTGNIFEIKVKGQKETIAAGGRYDKVVGKFLGRTIPAVGISFGIERLTSLSTVPFVSTKVICVSIKQDPQTIGITQKLRKNNIPCIPFFDKVGKALEYANAEGIPYAIFIGAEELEKKKLKLRDMVSGKEELLTEKQIITKLSKEKSTTPQKQTPSPAQ